MEVRGGVLGARDWVGILQSLPGLCDAQLCKTAFEAGGHRRVHALSCSLSKVDVYVVGTGLRWGLNGGRRALAGRSVACRPMAAIAIGPRWRWAFGSVAGWRKSSRASREGGSRT